MKQKCWAVAFSLNLFTQNCLAVTEEVDLKKLVKEALAAKDQTIAEMDKRLQKLEALTQEQQQVISRLQQEKNQVLAAEPAVVPPQAPPTKADAATASKKPLAEYFNVAIGKSVDHSEAEETEIGGFFDVTAQTKTNDIQAFHIGVVELSLDRVLSKGNFAASAALDWFPYGVSSGASIGAAFVDFHLYDDRIPLRGRIFQEPGFHIQAGQFDLPFSSDYQFFAVRDRLTVTPPMTTSRMQLSGSNPANGGLNSTGVRTYGQWQHLSYAAYAVDSLYSDGMAVGGRVGFLVNDPYRLHKQASAPLLDTGLSLLLDMDKSDKTQDKLYAADVSFSYENWRLLSEFMLHDSSENRNDGMPILNETGYHVTLIADLQNWLERALYVYGRYQEWNPNYDRVWLDDVRYAVNRIPAVTFGLGYRFNENLILKAEYNDTMGHQTLEPLFQSRYGIVQLVGSF